MTVNKVRYFAKHNGPLLGSVFWCITVLQAGLRATRVQDRSSLRALLSSRQRARLPGWRAQAMLLRTTSTGRTLRS